MKQSSMQYYTLNIHKVEKKIMSEYECGNTLHHCDGLVTYASVIYIIHMQWYIPQVLYHAHVKVKNKIFRDTYQSLYQSSFHL